MILLIDDDQEILCSVSRYLSENGFQILTSTDGDDAIKLLIEKADAIKLVIMDMLMPITDGIELCQFIRKTDNFAKLPVLMLTILSKITDKYNAFDVGADDYLTKPFELLELLMRVKSLLNRSIYHPTSFKTKDKQKNQLVINDKKSTITINGTEIYLTILEYSIIKYLYENSERYVSTDELLEKILGYKNGGGNPEAIRTHIKNLRCKIEDEPSNPKILINVPRRGYMYNKENKI